MSLATIRARRGNVSRAALLAAVAGLSFTASIAQAAVVDSGILATPIAIPATFAGLYFNVVTGVFAPTPAGAPGWDFNPYGATNRQFFWTPTAATNGGGDAVADVYRNLAVGAVVGPASTFSANAGAPAGVNFQGTGDRIIGFRFLNEAGGSVHFGYAVLNSASATGVPSAITRYVFESTPNTPITVTAAGPVTTAPIFGFTPAPGSTVNATGGTTVGSTGTFTITPNIATAGVGTGTAATTTLTCTAPTTPFAGFGQTITAIGAGAITGGPLTGTCTLGTAAATQTLTCSENRGGTATARTFTLSCPAGTVPQAPAIAVSTFDGNGRWIMVLVLLGAGLVGFRMLRRA